MARKQLPKREPSPEEIWQAAESSSAMLHAAQGRLSSRRLRLFAIACCKAIWGQGQAWAGYSEILQLAERMADSEDEQMSGLLSQAGRWRRVAYPHGVIHLLAEDAGRAASEWVNMVGLEPGESKRLVDVLLEIAGDPFSDIHLDSALVTWRDGTIPSLARACYESNDFSMIGILGDAMEEAGCDESTILEHLRGEHIHCRGCWVVDRILDKS